MVRKLGFQSSNRSSILRSPNIKDLPFTIVIQTETYAVLRIPENEIRSRSLEELKAVSQLLSEASNIYNIEWYRNSEYLSYDLVLSKKPP